MSFFTCSYLARSLGLRQLDLAGSNHETRVRITYVENTRSEILQEKTRNSDSLLHWSFCRPPTIPFPISFTTQSPCPILKQSHLTLTFPSSIVKKEQPNLLQLPKKRDRTERVNLAEPVSLLYEEGVVGCRLLSRWYWHCYRRITCALYHPGICPIVWLGAYFGIYMW